MAQYRLSVSIISRKEGRSATAMAAYRAGILMEDRRTGERFDFTRRSGVLHSEMVLPDNAPEWAHDRAEFWNRSELAETRQKAQVAREIQLSLPHELTDPQRRELTLTFAGHVTERYGLAVDVNIHAPGKHGDERNHHAHLLLSTRPFDPDSKTGFGNKNRDLDMIACKRNGKATEVEQLRAVWEEHSNQALKQANIRTVAGDLVQLDRRSYERQGVDQEPTVKLGAAASGLQRRGEDSERAAINDEIQERNALRQQLTTTLEQDTRLLTQMQHPSGHKAPPTPGGEGISMTSEEKRRQEDEAGLQHLRDAAKAFKQQQVEDGILRDIPEQEYTFEFDPSQNLEEQLRAYEQRLDMDEMAGKRAINRQQDIEKKGFVQTLDQAHRQLQDGDKAENHTDDLKARKMHLIESDIQKYAIYRQSKYESRDVLRHAEKDALRQTFEEHHKELDNQRHEALVERYDQARARLGEVYSRACGPEEPDPNAPQIKRSEPANDNVGLTRRTAQYSTAATLPPELKPPTQSNEPDANLFPARREAQNRTANDVNSDLEGPKDLRTEGKQAFKPLPWETEAEARLRSDQAQIPNPDEQKRTRRLGR